MTYIFQTGTKPCALELVLQSREARNIFVVGYDASNGDPYFRRICEIDPGQRRTFFFGMPISPGKLKVQIFDQDNRMFSRPDGYQIGNPRLVALRTAPINLSKESTDFLHFAEWLAVNLPNLQAGKDYVLDKKFKIQLFSDLPTSTPARIHATDDYIQVSKVDLLTMTVPRRIIILLHEYAHNYLNNNPNNESEADLNALTIYLAKGYPFMEAVYAFTKILHDNDQSVQRMEWMIRFMQQHQLYVDR